jgi:hypothetical protein
MPYMHVGGTVYKKKADGTCGAKVGTTKGDVHKYLAALHMHSKDKSGHTANAIKEKM